MKFEIRSRFDSSVLFSVETTSLKLAVELAINAGANLAGANLERANLEGVYLAGANLERANLEGAYLAGAYLAGAYLAGARGLGKFPLQIGGHRHWLLTTPDGRLRIGCEVHSFEEWRELAEELGSENDYSPLDVEIYKLHIEHLAKIAQLLWPKQEEPKA